MSKTIRKDFTLSEEKANKLKLKAEELGLKQSFIVDKLVGGFVGERTAKLNLDLKYNIQAVKKKTLQDIRSEVICPDYLPFPKFKVSAVVGKGGEGKTFLVMSVIASHILTEHYEREKESKVLAWLSEDDFNELGSRFRMITDDVFNLSEEDKSIVNSRLATIDSSSEVFHFVNYENKEATASEKFELFKEACSDFDLIILDPLIAFFGGNENDNSQARFFMQQLTQWAAQAQKTIIVIHHSTKGSGGLRGASAFQDAFRYVLEVKKHMIPDMEFVGEKEVQKYDILTGEKLFKEEQTKKHLRKVKVLKDNNNILGFVKKNFNIEDPRELSIQILPSYVCQDDLDEEIYTVPSKRFMSSQAVFNEEQAVIFGEIDEHLVNDTEKMASDISDDEIKDLLSKNPFDNK